VKKAYLLVLKHRLERQASGFYTVALLEERPEYAMNVSSSASLQLTSISQKGACSLIWNSDFYDFHPGDTSRSPVLGDSLAYASGPTELQIFAYFKMCYLGLSSSQHKSQ